MADYFFQCLLYWLDDRGDPLMRYKHVLKGLASASLVTAALALSGPAIADLDRLEREVRQEGREEARQHDRLEREVRQEGREEARQHDRMEREIRQEGKQKGRKLDRRL
jgi:hypothetical protein